MEVKERRPYCSLTKSRKDKEGQYTGKKTTYMHTYIYTYLHTYMHAYIATTGNKYLNIFN